MGQQVRFRRQASISLTSPGQKYVQQLGRGMIYRELVLRLSGTDAVTFASGASNAKANMGRGDEWSMINRIDVVANGTDVIRSFSGLQLLWLNRFLYNNRKRSSATWGDGSTAAPDCDSTLIIPFWQPLSAKPMDTAFDSSAVSDFRIEVTTNALSAITTGTAPTAIAMTLDIGSMESFGVTGVFSDCRIYPIQKVVAGASAQEQIQLPVGPLYRGWIINTSTTGAETSLDLADACTNVKVVSGTTVFRDIPVPMLRDWQNGRMGWQLEAIQDVAATAPITGGFLSQVRSGKAIAESTYFLDMVSDGLLTEALDSYGFSEIFLELNIAAACTVTVLPIQIYPRRNAAA